MNAYRWTVRVVFGGVALLTLWALFVAVTRIFDLVIAGVYPEAWVLTAMMTAPCTIGSNCSELRGHKPSMAGKMRLKAA